VEGVIFCLHLPHSTLSTRIKSVDTFEINMIIPKCYLIILSSSYSLSPMAYSPLPSLDDLTNREWMKLIDGQENLINFCQLVGLPPVTLNELCAKDHINWYLGSSSRAKDQYT
jgi:hypothetical protein